MREGTAGAVRPVATGEGLGCEEVVGRRRRYRSALGWRERDQLRAGAGGLACSSEEQDPHLDLRRVCDRRHEARRCGVEE